jgi:NAD(P)H-dependent FMN reductase
MISLIVGTNRPDSNTRKVAWLVEEIYTEWKVPLRRLDLAQLPPEIFSPDSYAKKPKSFQPFADAILQSDGLHVVTPELQRQHSRHPEIFRRYAEIPREF